MSRQEAVAQFIQANKLAQKHYKTALSRGAYPYLPVLEDLLRDRPPVGRMELGLVKFPAKASLRPPSSAPTTAAAGKPLPGISCRCST